MEALTKRGLSSLTQASVCKYGFDIAIIRLKKQGFVIKTKRRAQTQSKVFINVCSSPKLEPPSSSREQAIQEGNRNRAGGGTHWQIPFSLSTARACTDKAGDAAESFDFTVNPDAVKRASTQPKFKVRERVGRAYE